MPWFKVDDNFADHPKVRRIPRAARGPAIGLWTLAGSWSARHLRDGHVPAYMVDELAAKPSSAEALVKADLWHVAGHQCTECPAVDEGVFLYHDWPSCQPTKADVEAERAAARERQRKAREKARSQRESRRDSTVTHNETGPLVTDLPTRPDPSQPKEELKQGGDRYETSTPPAATEPHPEEPRCAAHPAGDHDGPCGGCAKVREWRDRNERQARDQASSARAQCPDCGGTGWREDDHGNPTGKCEHDRPRRTA